MLRFKDKVVLLTAAAKGIGRACALRFAREGAHVVFSDVDDEAGSRTLEELKAIGVDVRYLHCDVSHAAEVESIVHATLAAHGEINVLHSNAAYLQGFAPVGEASQEDWDQQMAVSLRGAFMLTKEVLPGMVEKRRGAIILTASILSHVAIPGFAAYCTAKGGLLQLMRSLAVDYGRFGVRVNAVCPGPISTWSTGSEPPREFSEFLTNSTILKRWGTPDEVASCVAFLASDDASFVTGTYLLVDGGWSAM